MENHFMPNKGGKLCINVQNRTHFRRLELHPKIKISVSAFRLNTTTCMA